MDTGIRAARDAVAMEGIATAAMTLAERFGVPFDAVGVARFNRDPEVKALFLRETLSAFLQALVTATEPKPELEESPATVLPKADGHRGAARRSDRGE